MCLDSTNSLASAARHQRGYLMPLALFVLVAMSLMAITITRSATQSGVSAAQETVTLQAFYSAESGAQLAMHQLFYNTSTPITRALVDSRCNGLSINQVFNAQGLSNCEVAVSCAITVAGASSFYTITSIGQCGSDEIRSTRTVEVSAAME